MKKKKNKKPYIKKERLILGGKNPYIKKGRLTSGSGQKTQERKFLSLLLRLAPLVFNLWRNMGSRGIKPAPSYHPRPRLHRRRY